MSFEKQDINGVQIVRINTERFDSNIAPELKTELLLIVEQGNKNILIDLSKVIYVDSSGLGALLFGLRQARDKEGKLKIFGANSRVLNLIRIAKLEQILLNFEREDEALASFK